MLLVLTGGSVAVAAAHKTVTLDVDGEIRQVSTFAGSVEGLLEDHDVEHGRARRRRPRARTHRCASGDEIVVRHAHADDRAHRRRRDARCGRRRSPPTRRSTTLAPRGDDVRAPRLPLRWRRSRRPVRCASATGTVDVVVDGRTEHGRRRPRTWTTSSPTSTSPSVSSTGCTCTARPADASRSSCSGSRCARRPARPRSRSRRSSSRPTSCTAGSSAGRHGRRGRRAHHAVPGRPRRRRRGVPRACSPRPSRPPRSPTSSARAPEARPGRHRRRVAVGGDVWGALAACESGGNPVAVSSNGLYYGLYQFSLGTWQAMGGTGLPTEASAEEQTQRAQALQARSGLGPVARLRRASSACSSGRVRRPLRRNGSAPARPYPARMTTDALLGPAQIRDLAGRLGVRPTKTRGQNFVVDAGTIRKIVRTAGVRAGRAGRRGRAGPRLADPRAARGRCARRRRSRSTRSWRRELPLTVGELAPGWSDRLTVVHGRRARGARAAGRRRRRSSRTSRTTSRCPCS